MKTLIEILDEMFLSYVRTENYVSLNEEARNEFCDQFENLRQLAITEVFRKG